MKAIRWLACVLALATLALATIGLLGLRSAAPIAASGDTLFVDALGDCGGNSPCYPHPQDAVNAAYPGDTVLVYPGTYDSRYNVCDPEHPTWCSENDNWAPALIVYKDGLIIRSVDGPTNTIIQSTHNFWSNAIAVQNSTGGGITGISGWAPSAITVVANNVTIDGFTLHRPYDGTWATYNTAGVFIGSKGSGYPDFLGQANGATVQNSIFSNLWHAVYIWHSSGNQILDNTVQALGNTGHWAGISIYDGDSADQINLGSLSKDNVIQGNTLADKGISVGAWQPPVPTDNSGTKIVDNTVKGDIAFFYTSSSGVEVRDNTLLGPGAGRIIFDLSNSVSSFTSCVVSGNTVGAGTGNGIQLFHMTGGSVSDNDVSSRAANGIALLNSGNVDILGNSTTDNGASGIVLVNSSGMDVTDNVILRNAGNTANPGGLTVREGVGPTTVVDNTISNNTQYGVWISPTALDGNVFHLNNIVANGVGMLNNTAFLVNAEDNWWGSANGPTHASNKFNVGSQGQSVSDNVDFVPWLNAEPLTGVSFAPVTNSEGESYASIQAAVDGTDAAGTVSAATGVFSEDVSIGKSLTVQAASSPTIDCGGSGNGITLNASNVTIDGFEIRNCDNGISGQTSSSVISDNDIHDNLNTPGSAGVGILLWGDNDNNQISGNTVYNNDRQGVFVGHCDFAGPDGDCTTAGTLVSSGNTISGNVIHDNGLYTQPNGPDASQYGIQLWNADENEIGLNEIWNHKGFGFGIGVYLCNADSNDVHDNTVHDNQYNIAASGCEGSSAGNNIHLNTLSAPTDSNVRLFVGSPSNTVNDNTMSGGVYGVRVSPGNTDTAVTASDILGFSQNGVRIDGSSDVDVSTNNIDGQGACNSSSSQGSSPETDTRCYGVEWIDSTGTISANTITGVKIGAGTGAQTGVGIRASARSGKTTTVTIDHNVVGDYQKNGMAITGQYGGTVSATVDTNTVTGFGPVSFIAQNGIQVSSGAVAMLVNNEVSGHDYTPATDSATGVLVVGGTATIQGNNLHDNMEGAYLESATIPEFSDNTVTDTRDTGVYLFLTDDGTVSGNTITGAANGLWIADSNNATVRYNTISDNDQGIVIDGTSSNASIYGNDILRNAGSSTSGVHVQCYDSTCPTNIELHFNNIVGNSPIPGAYGVYNDTTNVLNATSNWWGSCTGPYHPIGNPFGLGDAVSDNVGFTPWISGPCDADGDGLTDDQEKLITSTDPNDPDTDHDGFFDGPVDVDGPGLGQPNDNCPNVANSGQENADNQIGNGIGIPGHDSTVPNSAGDNIGDACDSPDADNDGIANASDSDPGGDITYDDNNNGIMCPVDTADDGPSWDHNCNGKLDGKDLVPGSCPLAVNPRGDDDGDGLKNTWEVCKWGTDPTKVDTDGDTLGDCKEAADVDGNRVVDFTGDVMDYAQAIFMAPAAFGQDGDFDVDGNNNLDFTGDVMQEAQLALIDGLCK
jgi:parallel beta-helix repeat protein